jgi:arylsulfatase A-like enzyme
MISFALLLVLPGNAGFAEAAPNIVLILTDDQGWSQVSHLADPRIPASTSPYLETPNMSRSPEQGLRFTSGYSPAPLCTPTRPSILCGTSTARCGSEFKSSWVPAEHDTMEATLLAFLKSVDAETPSDIKPKRKAPKRKEKR